jgi:arsenite/tail-anchored protein-transporting ATPase
VDAALLGRRCLVVSTDPAPSLGDAFARAVGPEPRKLPTRRGALHAVEIDAPSALARWLKSRRAVLERIALRGTWLDKEDVSALLRLSLPGIDELAALLEIARLAAAGTYDLIVVDTAPTGHTLRMLATPEILQGMAGVFDRMQAKHRVVVEALRGGWRPDAEDALVTEIDDEARRLAALLRDPASVRFSWVTLPEPMAIEETADAAAALAAAGITLSDIIVNRMTPLPDRRCSWCDARRVLEALSIRSARTRLPGVSLIPIAARDREPRGMRALASIGSEHASVRRLELKKDRPRKETRYSPAPPAGGTVVPTLATDETRLLLFGGKGGVGKTTCAAAAAIGLAGQLRSRRVLLLSTDPAHSLSDVLGVPVSDEAQPVRGGPANLRAREIDAALRFQHVRERYAAGIDRWFDRLSRGGSSGIGVDAGYDRRVMQGLMDLAPPGIDELTAVIEVTDALDEKGDEGADLIVMDTAPSGHALRLLEMPALAQDWARALMSILLKYQPVAGLGELGAVLLRMSQGLGRLKTLLADPRRTSFVAVTRAAILPREETHRLVSRLTTMDVQVPLILVNAVGRGTCARCRAASMQEARELKKLARLTLGANHASVAIGIAPAEMPPPHGVVALRRWQSSWRSRPREGS